MKLTATIFSVLLLSGALALAQQPGPEGGGAPREGRPGQRMGAGPMLENLFPPPVIMEAGEEIGLTEAQRQSIKEEMEKMREQFEAAQKKVREEVESLTTLLKADRVDEAQVLGQLDKVLAAEGEMKKLQLSMLIHIKNLLTAEQQEKLRAYMKAHPPQRRETGPREPREPGNRGERSPQPPQRPPNE